jgi:hypothetical protein
MKRFLPVLIVIAVLSLAVAAADRSKKSWDLSADRRFTVSPELATILHAQSEAVELVGLWPAEIDGAAQPVADAAKRMADVSPQVRFRRLDPVLDKPGLAAFVAAYHEATAPALYVTRSGRAFRIALTDRTRLTVQQEVGGALVALADPHPPLVAVVQGHGELRPGGGDDDGADRLLRAWELAGLDVRLCDLGRDRVKADAVLALLGPMTALGAMDLAALDRHLKDGGPALIVADDRAPTELVAFLRQRGVALGGLARDEGAALAADPAAFLHATPVLAGRLPVLASRRRYAVGREQDAPEPNLLCDRDLIAPDLPFTRAIADSGRGLLSPWTTPVTVLDPASLADRAVAERLAAAFTAAGTPPFIAAPWLRTAPADAWPKARATPLTVPSDLAKRPAQDLAWAMSWAASADSVQAGHQTRLVVWGSRQAASDGVLGQERFANADLLCQATRWLADRQTTTAIPAAETAVFRVDCSDDALGWITAILAAILPSICIGLAILWWWERR